MLWCFGAVPQQDLAPCQVGDVVAVKDEGHRDDRGNGYELFRVVVDRDAPASVSPDVGNVAPSMPLIDAAPLTCEHCGDADPHKNIGLSGYPI